MRNIIIPFTILLAFNGILAVPCLGQKKPNVIFVLADDLGYGDLGCYGGEDLKTPAIDQLAKNGVTYSKAYANSSVCSPSRAAILFGDYPDLVGVPGVIRDMPHNTWGNLKDDLVSLPDKLSDIGYQTALIGKWHLGYQAPDLPNHRGFDFFKGFVGDMMDDYVSHLRAGVNWMRENEHEINPKGHATDLFTDWSIDYIKNASKQEQPFFLFLAYNAPHDPVQPPKEYLDKVKKRAPTLPLKRQKLIALIEHLDANVGRMLGTLKEEGLAENTIVIFTSDNGGALNHGASNAPLNGGKGDMLEGGIRVPCIVSWPDQLRSGKNDSSAILMNFYHGLPEVVTGKSPAEEILSITDQKIKVWVRREGHKFGGRAYYAISDGRYKLLQNGPFEKYKLYDLQTDPKESQPITNEKIRKYLFDKLTAHIQKSGKISWQ